MDKLMANYAPLDTIFNFYLRENKSYNPNNCLNIGNAFGNRSNSQLNRLKLKLKALFFGIVTSSVPQSLSASKMSFAFALIV